MCRDTVRRTPYDGSCEDLFFFVERLIAERAGDVAGRLHTARSRNDIDMTMYRMRQRGFVLDLLDATLALRTTLGGIAAAHLETVFPAHTHTQRAQPTTLAHYLLGVIEQLERDGGRLRAAFATTNRSPLGACAITGTAFPIDRDRTSALLGFDGPTGNTYGSIATVDYLLESLSAASVALVGVGRVVQDLLLWCTAEFRYLRLGDGFVQVSSIMPQKRNPVALEHARSIGSKALGQATAVMLSVHNTPFGDIVDTEDDLQPLVQQTFRDAVRAVSLVAASLRTATFDAAEMGRRAGEGFITVTELADTLTREHGLPFVQSHAIAAGLIEAHRAAPERPLREHADRRVDAGHRRRHRHRRRRGCATSSARRTSSASARRSAVRRRPGRRMRCALRTPRWPATSRGSPRRGRDSLPPIAIDAPPWRRCDGATDGAADVGCQRARAGRPAHGRDLRRGDRGRNRHSARPVVVPDHLRPRLTRLVHPACTWSTGSSSLPTSPGS